MNRLIIFVFLSALAVSAYATTFDDCGSEGGQVSSVEVTNCPDGEDECVLKRGTQAGITINFTSKEEAKSLKAVVHGVIASVPMPFPLPQPDACKSGVSCPLKNGQSYTYSNSLNIRSAYPAIPVTVKWELQDENNKDVVCVTIPARLE